MKNTIYALLLTPVIIWIICMCLNPYFKSNGNYVTGSRISQAVYEIPCGVCKECQLAKQTSWAIRAVVETQRCLGKNGIVSFNTMTYNRHHVPKLFYTTPSINGSLPQIKFIKTWNTTHVKNLFKKLRINIARRFYDGNQKAFVIKYACFKEKGSNDLYLDDKGRTRRAQQLPHYHTCTWFYSLDGVLPKDAKGKYLDTFVFNSMFNAAWGYYDKKSDIFYKYGNCFDEALVRTPAKAAEYCTKYSAKSIYADEIKDLLPNFWLHNQGLRNSKDMLPRIQSSKGLGYSKHFIDSLVHNGVPTEKLLSGELPNPFNSDKPSVALPAYYKNRLLKVYNYVSHHEVADVLSRIDELDTLLKYSFLHPTEKQFYYNERDSLYGRLQELQKLYMRRKLAALVDGKYYPARMIPVEEYVTSKTEYNDSGILFRLVSLQRKVDSILPLFVDFLILADGGTPYCAANYSNDCRYMKHFPKDSLSALKIARANALRYLSSEAISILNKPFGRRILQYCLTAPPTTIYRHPDMLHDYECINTWFTLFQYEKRFKNAITYYNNDIKSKRQLVDKMQEYPELFKPRVI